MARFIFATQPITGHVLPALPMVRALVAGGHEVVWYVGKAFRSRVEAVGARFAPYQQAYDYDDSNYDTAFPGRGKLKDLDQIKFDFINLFMKQISPQHRDLEAIMRDFPADVIVGDPSVGAAMTFNEQYGTPYAIYNITCLGIKSRDTAPFGLGLLPSRSPIGRLRNRALSFLASNIIFKDVSAEMGRQCDLLGVRRRKFEGVMMSPYLFMEPTVPSFEYPRSDLPPVVHFIGALLPDTAASFTPPVWWSEVEQKSRPVVLVTQGTVATHALDLVAPTLKALAAEDVLVIVAGVKDASAIGIDPLPANVRIEAFVPFKQLMPHVDVYVTNGGFGGVQFALASGVPIVAAGTTEDKPEIANRVAYSGVGVNLKTSAPSPETVRAAVKSVLSDAGYRHRAQRIQAELATHDAPAQAVRLLEQLAETRQPVVSVAPTAPGALPSGS
jgi:UDP:flavonoid glycosyltransferase YjiC (YdhE family)